ncbi:NAD(P)H-binding protein [Phytomonospora sp. NPDC050363]|uniref:NAD(P)H-binding protein n=1 Tax=Phytomonospora sp. NPDC050363 TaxID=3155642 RepID=UPI003404C756
MILVTGATGTVGRETVSRLPALGHAPKALTRDPAAAFPDGTDVVHGDASRPSTYAAALDGVEALLVSPRAVGAGLPELLGEARTRGVERVVLLSAITVEYGGGFRRFAEGFRAAENAVAASGLAHTFLRLAQFAGNTRVWAPQIREHSAVRCSYGDAATSPIHERDIAAVAALTLTDPAHAGRSHALTGPKSLTQREHVAAIAAALGREVPWIEVPPEEAGAAMVARGVPAEIPQRMYGYLAECLREPGPTTDTLAELLGRPPLTYGDWAEENAEAFR